MPSGPVPALVDAIILMFVVDIVDPYRVGSPIQEERQP